MQQHNYLRHFFTLLAEVFFCLVASIVFTATEFDPITFPVEHAPPLLWKSDNMQWMRFFFSFLFSFFFFCGGGGGGEFRVEYSYVPVCQTYVLVCYSNVLVFLFLVCYSYVTRMYSYVLVCYSYVTRMYSYVTRMYWYRYPYVIRMSPVWCITHDLVKLGPVA